jgi:D-alanyl-D-alanine carboxypeptidase
MRPGAIVMTTGGEGGVAATLAAADQAPERVARISTSGGRHWGVTLGRFGSRGAAERALIQTALLESGSLGEALRKVAQRGGGYDANFLGLTADQADLACRRLQARAIQCFTLGP